MQNGNVDILLKKKSVKNFNMGTAECELGQGPLKPTALVTAWDAARSVLVSHSGVQAAVISGPWVGCPLPLSLTYMVIALKCENCALPPHALHGNTRPPSTVTCAFGFLQFHCLGTNMPPWAAGEVDLAANTCAALRSPHPSQWLPSKTGSDSCPELPPPITVFSNFKWFL